MFEAARVTDPIDHTSALAGFLVGAVLGIALIAAVAFATFTCGFGVALLAGMMAGIGAQALLSIGESIGKMFSSQSGNIITGSPDVYVNSMSAAYATLSGVACSKHNPIPLVAQGSTNIFINGRPAARKNDKITCGATIADGSHDTFFHGGTQTYLPVDDEVPPWLRTATDWAFALAGLVGGLGGLLKASGGLSRAVLPCAAKFIGGYVLGEAVGRYVAGPAINKAIGGMFGNPVDVTTGRKILLAESEIDYVIPSPIPVEIKRFYSSSIDYAGTLGRGWVLPWELRLHARDGRLWYTDAQGRESGFPLLQAGQAAFSEAEQRYLTCTPDGRYILHDVGETYYDFGRYEPDSGRIAWVRRIEDQAGQWYQFERDSRGRVTEILTCGGLQAVLGYEGEHGRLGSVTLVHGDERRLAVTYEYDENGQLASVTDANGAVVRRFTYANGLMASHVNALGFTSSYVWSTIEGQPRVVATRTSEGEDATLEYDIEGRQTRIRYADGRTAHWLYDAQLQIIEYTDLDGGFYRIKYNDAGMPVLLMLPGERTVVFEYDDAGRIVAETDPLGRTTRTRYDGNSMRPVEIIGADGGVWRAKYDPQGRLLSSQDQLGRESRYEYPKGLTALPIARVDARGGRKMLEWNRLGALISYTDCAGKTSRAIFDAFGLLQAHENALGQRTTYDMRPTGEPYRITYPDGSAESFEYDAAGLVVRHIGLGGRIRQWLRNARGQLVEAIDAAGRRSRYQYDAEGRLREFQQGHARYAFTYRAGGRLLTETRPDGIQRRYEYGEAGDLLALEIIGNPDNSLAGNRTVRTIRFERDRMGILKVQHTPTEVTRYEHDRGGRLVKVERVPTSAGIALGIAPDVVRFEYDKVGRLVAEHGANGTVKYTLDVLDNVTTLELPHDQTLQLLRYGSGHVHQIRCGDQVISDFERDDLHREITRTQGRLVQRLAYDPLGRKVWQAAGFPAEGLGRGRGQLWRNYGYDAAGELIEMSDNLRGNTQYNYDPAGRLARLVNMVDRQLERFAWDAAGNMLGDAERRSRGYVEGNRLRMWQDLRFEYDPFGNLAAKLRGASRTQRFTYDGQDRLIAVRSQDARGVVETRFAYDPLGRRIEKSDTFFDIRGVKQRSETKRFVWEGMRLVQEVRETGVSSYVYSPDAPYSPAARIDAVIAKAIAVATIETAKRPARIYHFHTDLVGAPLEVTDESGELVWAGRYGAWGKVESGSQQSATARTTQPLRYAGQYADDSTGLHYNTFRYYDPEVGRFINQDPIGLLGGDNLYQYAPNPLSWADPWGLAAGDYGQMPSYPGWQLHHNIPQNLADHPAIVESGYDLNTSRNITRLPTSSSVDPSRTVHRGMHTQAYNDMVESGLDRIHANNASPEIKAMQIQALSDDIGGKLRTKQIRLNKAC
ncbi:RHS repeat-associated core domain-containing protein [Burkholderia pseudomultivorans]|uniref:RHS repeat-associated core domain-containing protein n=1 Tax=Burkholderia pseudomultivorans TaxID=1207504 RepID=UPI00188E30A1|nr:RHS repeat-associated core domain-containing protein [Burkholderia pseudomultivorans]MBF5012706.1 RHS domain-containing protein [Burkholderia pseudomultivorans]